MYDSTLYSDYVYPVKRKPSIKQEVKKSVAVGGLKPPIRDTFLMGLVGSIIFSYRIISYFILNEEKSYGMADQKRKPDPSCNMRVIGIFSSIRLNMDEKTGPAGLFF